jgi:hypothetical protein
MANVGDAVIGAPEASADDGTYPVIVSWAVISYPATNGSVIVHTEFDERTTADRFASNAARTWIFHPAASLCADTRPITRSDLTASSNIVLIFRASLLSVAATASDVETDSGAASPSLAAKVESVAFTESDTDRRYVPYWTDGVSVTDAWSDADRG